MLIGKNVTGSLNLPGLTILLLLVLSLSLSLGAQDAAASSKAHLSGKLLDPSSAAVAGAQIMAVPEGRDDGPLTTSDENGGFTFTLDPGRYTMKVIARGFQRLSQDVTLAAGVAETIEFSLRVAGGTDTITVTEPAGYRVETVSSATKTPTALQDVPQSVTVMPQELVRDQMMMSVGDVVRYVPGITAHQGENNRDQVVIRGNSSSADFFLNGMRDDVQYYRDLYNLDRIEALKGPNAMVFGRGGGGGVINRVTKEASQTPLHEITLLGGAFGDMRLAGDFDQPLNDKVALRLNGVYEHSGSFRDFVHLDRSGINPTLTFLPSANTKLTVGFEHFLDHRTADRGIPSYQGRPVDVDISTYYGNPFNAGVRANVNIGSVNFVHQAGTLTIRNGTLFGGYDRGYQNYVPGAVTANMANVALSAYNNATNRLNIINQTDVTYIWITGKFKHTILAGAEFGRQYTDNFRNTGYFNNTATSILIPYNNTVISTPTTFRQSATDADNHVDTTVAAGYLQDQILLTPRLQLLAGLRFDRFDLGYHNNRNGDNLDRADNLLSPRLGIVFKPVPVVSLYGSYSVSYLPSSGDQFSSLTTITQQVKPEKFTNYEVGAKWELNRKLSLTMAGYRLNRTNTRSTDPNDPTRIVQTGSQRTNGFEVGFNGTLTGKWRIAGGYAYQDAFITSATAAARLGAQVAEVPHNTFSMWNNYQIIPRLGVGLGLVGRTDMFAAIDDTVVLPGYLRADAAVYFNLTERVRLQANVENLLDKKYYVNADNNNNISPGYPVTARVGVTWTF